MSTALIIPEKNEGDRPLFVAQQGLQARGVDAIYFVDGWSTDDTYDRLQQALPALRQRFPGKSIELQRSELRETGKGGAMITGLKCALAAGFEQVVFLDGDIASVTARWCELLLRGLNEHKAAMARGYFDRSPLDAQITRHITRPLIAIYFPEGRAIHQPLGGEIALTADLGRFLLQQPLAPPHHWGIDTFLTVSTVVGGFPLVEVYLTQKTHKKKSLTELRSMLVECFDELCKQIAFHKRHQGVPATGEVPVTVLSKEDAPERIGEDVRTQQYANLDEQIDRFFIFVRGLRRAQERLDELGLTAEQKDVLLSMFDRKRFPTQSAQLNARSWVPLLDKMARGYIARGFTPIYHDVIFAAWQLRALSFALHETQTFEQAEQQTEEQSQYAYEYGQRYRAR